MRQQEVNLRREKSILSSLNKSDYVSSRTRFNYSKSYITGVAARAAATKTTTTSDHANQVLRRIFQINNQKKSRSDSKSFFNIRWSCQVASMLFCLSTLLLAVSLLASATQEISNGASNSGIASNRAAIEAELNNLLQQHDGSSQDANSKLSEAIISRLMLGNLSESLSELTSSAVTESNDNSNDESQSASNEDQLSGNENEQQANSNLLGPDALRLRKLMSFLHNYELAQATGGLNGGQVFNQYPILPESQASTIKRASVKMGNYLKSQNGARQATSYGRNNFDFGLGKRPDSSVANNILRFGDSSIGASGHVVSGGLGKRPSAHRFDFGLGKRVASPAYPRYDFGLGKRAPNRIRYDFGLGK